MKKKVTLLACTFFAVFFVSGNFLGTTAHAAAAAHVVISEVYGGGGNSGAPYKNDFIELYNPTSNSISLSGWSVQYASASGTFNNITNLSGTIPAYGYFLIKGASGGSGTADLPAPNITGTINLSGSSGKVALAKVTTAVSGSSDSNVVDFVGYGSVNDSEASPAAAPSNTTSVERKDNSGGTAQGQGNGWDTNNNANDLYVTSSVNPQNSSSQSEPSVEVPAAQDNDPLALGNPSGATTDTSNSNNYLMIKTQYTLSYNNSKHIPNWVSWHLNSSDIGSASRQDDFRADTTLPTGWYRVTATEFSGSGFDRGHMCPSGDRTSTTTNNSATFLMTNMLPQAPNNNQITWNNLEAYCRTLVSSGNELYIISGGYGSGGTGSNGYKTTVGNGVVVPAKTWKVIVILTNGNNDISRITTSTRVIAVVMPNDQTCSSQPWGNYRVSVDSIEALTGYDFLSLVPVSIQSIIEAKVDNGSVN